MAATDRAERRPRRSRTSAPASISSRPVSPSAAWRTPRTTSGTSLSAAYVAGAAARVLQLQPDLSPDQVAGAIADQATPDVVTDPGAGTPNRLLYTGFLDDAAARARAGRHHPAIHHRALAITLAGVADDVTGTASDLASTADDAPPEAGGPAAAVASGKGVELRSSRASTGHCGHRHRQWLVDVAGVRRRHDRYAERGLDPLRGLRVRPGSRQRAVPPAVRRHPLVGLAVVGRRRR